MGVVNTLSDGFASIIEKAGKPIRIRYYSQTTGSVWDDEVSLSEIAGSGVWASGVVLPVGKYGSEDAILLEQGKISYQDQKLYVNGSLDFTGIGSNLKVKIGINGSPTQIENYTMILDGGIPYEFQGNQIYKRVYIRKLTNGSLIGET